MAAFIHEVFCVCVIGKMCAIACGFAPITFEKMKAGEFFLQPMSRNDVIFVNGCFHSVELRPDQVAELVTVRTLVNENLVWGLE